MALLTTYGSRVVGYFPIPVGYTVPSWNLTSSPGNPWDDVLQLFDSAFSIAGGGSLFTLTGSLGIGVSPSTQLHVQSSGGVTEALIQNTNAGGFALLLLQNNTPQKYQIAMGGSSTGAPEANSFYIYDATNTAIRLLITSGGNVMIPNQPSYANNAAAISGGLTAGMLYLVTSSNPRQVAIVF